MMVLSLSSVISSKIIFMIDREQIEQAFQMILAAPNEDARKQADAFLRDQEKNNPLVLLTLLDIFENSQVFVNRYQSLILMKNIIVRNWPKSEIKDSKRVAKVSEEVKMHIKQKIVSFLGVIQDPKLKKEINVIIQSIAKYDFPQKFPMLTSYFIQGLQIIDQQIKDDPQQLYSRFTLDLIITLKAVEQEVNKNRISAFKNMQYEFVSGILNTLIHLWKACTALQQNDLTCRELNHVSKKLDRLLSSCLMCHHAEVDLDRISTIFIMLLQKTIFLLNEAKTHKSLQSNVKTLAHSLTNIQQLFPVSVVSGLLEHLQLLHLLVTGDWEDKRITKIGLLGIIKVLKSYCYYCTDEQIRSIVVNPKHPNYFTLRSQCSQIYFAHFENKISALLDILMRIASVPSELEEEDIIEQEEDLSIEDMKSEFQCPTYTLCLITVEQLMSRFPQITIQTMTQLLLQLQNCQFQVPNPGVLESFFALLGQAPRVTLKHPELSINIIPVLQFLSASRQVQQLRRCAVLCNRYIMTFNTQELTQVLALVIQLIQYSSDQIVLYQCLMCVKSVVNSQGLEISVDWSQIMEKTIPAIVGLLQTLKKSNIVWPLLHLLEKLILKSQKESTLEKVIVSMNSANLTALMTTNQQILVEALCDMLKILLVSFPLGTPLSHIYRLCLTLIQSNLRHLKLSSVVNFYKFILQEYNEVQGLHQELAAVFDYFLKQINDENLDLIVAVLGIIEENLLLGIIPPQQVPQLIQFTEVKYNIGRSMQEHEMGLHIIDACLSMVQTIQIHFIAGNKASDMSLLTPLMTSILPDMVHSKSPHYIVINFQVKVIDICNRFIIQDAQGFIQFLQQLSCPVESYIQVWAEHGNLLKSWSQKKANIIAMLQILRMVPTQIFAANFQQVISTCLPDIHYEQELKDPQFRLSVEKNKLELQNNPTNRQSPFRISSRKQHLLEVWVYPEISIESYIARVVKECMLNHKIEDLKAIVNDKQVFDQVNEMIVKY